jgi:putative ABC transport system permease protein
MMRLAPRLRGLAQRGGTTVMILAVALVATAAAATGPIYYAAARTSILRDSLATAPVTGRGYEANETGAVASLLGQLAPVQQGQLETSLGGLTGRGLFAPPLYSIETTVPFPQELASVPLVWRSDLCAHLRIDGACPAARGQVIVSRDTAASVGWHIGQILRFPGYSALTITGLYRLPDQSLDYWFGRGSTYFPVTTTSIPAKPAIDAMFATRSTLEQSPAGQQGTAVVDDMLNSGRMTGDEVAPLSTAMTAFSDSQVLSDQQILISTTIPATLQTVESGRSSVAVPVVLITAQLLVLCLLLLFLAVTDAVEARGPEIALAKLRGRGAWSTVAFGLSEPVTLLALALPAGILAGWGATAAISHGLLRPGTPVVLPGLAWAAAAATTAGGLAAARPRRAARPGGGPSWRSGGIPACTRPTAAGWWMPSWPPVRPRPSSTWPSAGRSAPPGPARSCCWCPGCWAWRSRSSPPGCCRWAAGPPSPARAGAAASDCFSPSVTSSAGRARRGPPSCSPRLSRWPLSPSAPGRPAGRDNQQHVAAITVGAPTVLTVGVPAGEDLSTIVARADPGGRMAAAVDSYTSLASGSAGLTTLAVDPGRFAHVAAWLPRPHGPSLTALAPKLDPPPAPAGHPHRGRRPPLRPGPHAVAPWRPADRRRHDRRLTRQPRAAARPRHGHADRAAGRLPLRAAGS